MKVLTASIAASLCGFIGLWLLEWRERLELWAGIESVKWDGVVNGD